MLNIESLDTPETATFSITIAKTTRDQAGLYAKLVHRTLSDVIGIMLERFMERDKEFQKHWSEQADLRSAPEPATKKTQSKTTPSHRGATEKPGTTQDQEQRL